MIMIAKICKKSMRYNKYKIRIMSEQFESRLEKPEALRGALQEVFDRCGLGCVAEYTLVDVGFEDYNVIVVNEVGQRYFVKVLAKSRTYEEIARYASIIEAAIAAGVNHPPMYRDEQGSLRIDTASMSMFVMDVVDGRTFYESETVPNDEQLKKIMDQVVKISRIPLVPTYEYDGWAIPNIREMHRKVSSHIDQDAKPYIDEALRQYESLSVAELPTCFVHGDLTKANIIAGNDGNIYIIDFSVANIYPRIQELVVVATSLMSGSGNELPIRERLQKLANLYIAAGGELSELERESMFPYALAGFAMEYLGALNEQVTHGDSDEIYHWKELGIKGLKEALQ